MRLISWTLAGGHGAAEALPRALASVAALCDGHFVLSTDPTIEEQESVIDAALRTNSQSLHLESWHWRNDYGAARNAAIERVSRLHPNWSLMIDTDETAVCSDHVAMRVWLSTLPERVQVVLVRHVGGDHTRERLFRHPVSCRFVGRTHEQFVVPSADVQAIAPPELLAWDEAKKTQEQLRAKLDRDVKMLWQDIDDDPKNHFAWLYLGITYQYLCQWDAAILAYRKVTELDGCEAAAWAAFKAGECYLELKQPDRAIDAALAGMARDAGFAELPWLAAIASCHAGRLEQARCWAELARVHSQGGKAERRRISFRNLRGVTGEGPNEVLAFCRENGAA